MSLRSMFATLYAYVRPVKKQTRSYVLYIGSFVLCATLVLLGVFGYRLYKTNKEEKAQEVFSACMHEYDKAERDEKLWPNAELVFRLGFQENGSTAMAPYFLAFQAEALLHMDKFEQARTCMEQAVSLSYGTPIYYLYATKHALMMMDDAETSNVQKGLDMLDRLAQDEKNSTRDMALYYLGLYHWEKDEREKATKTWDLLAQLTIKEPASPWAQLALEKSEHIVI